MVETVTVVVAVQAAATPAGPAPVAGPPTAPHAPATATPTPPTATPAGLVPAAVPPTPTPAAAPVEPALAPTPVPPAAVPATPAPTAAPAASGLAGIQVSYRLDPWLIGGTYGGELWVSPAVFGPTTQGGNTFTLQVRAQGLDGQGNPMVISPQWKPADPETLAVSPSQGSVVMLTVQRPGQSSLQVVSQGFSKTLSIVAAYQGSALLVEIAQ
ncbi:MAG: hypothetical protein Q8R28_05115 [Dehalococcoidia bacterium]|nr:hypothetical protein [Dehalococcoidia bacterium]